MKNYVVVACLSGGLAGCSGMPAYQPPQAGPMAQVRVATAYNGVNMQVRRFQAADCSDYPGELIGRLNSKTIGETYSPELTTTARAGEPFRVGVYAVADIKASMRAGWIRSTVTFCQPALEFVPRPGSRYEILHRVGQNGCSLDIVEVEGPRRSAVQAVDKGGACEAAYYRTRR